MFYSFLSASYIHTQYIWTSVCPDWWSPGSYARGDEDMSLSFLFVACGELKKAFNDEIEWPELSIMGMTRELYVYAIFLCF